MINLKQILDKHDKYNDISETLLPSILAAMKEACELTVTSCVEAVLDEDNSKDQELVNSIRLNILAVKDEIK